MVKVMHLMALRAGPEERLGDHPMHWDKPFTAVIQYQVRVASPPILELQGHTNLVGAVGSANSAHTSQTADLVDAFVSDDGSPFLL